MEGLCEAPASEEADSRLCPTSEPGSRKPSLSRKDKMDPRAASTTDPATPLAESSSTPATTANMESTENAEASLVSSATEHKIAKEENTGESSADPPTNANDPAASSTPDADLPEVLTNGPVSVSLENHSVWMEFHHHGTEMIVTKQGRRMFPYCFFRLRGLDPALRYSLFLSITPTDPYKHRWTGSKWEASGQVEPYEQRLPGRAFTHECSPATGKELMVRHVSFRTLKLTNNIQESERHAVLQTMRRYQPSLHVIPIRGDSLPDPHNPLFSWPGVMTFTFPQMVFYSVTTYQNMQITQLKIDHNPFARGFREDKKHEAPQAERFDSRDPGLVHPRPRSHVSMKDPDNVGLDLSCRKRTLSTSAEVDGKVHAKLWRVGSSPSETSDVSAGEEGLDADNTDSDHALHRQLRRTQLTLASGQTGGPKDGTPSHAGPGMQSAVTLQVATPVEVQNLIICASLTPSQPKAPQLKKILPRPLPSSPKPSPDSFLVPKSFTRGKKPKFKGKGATNGRCGPKAGSAPVTPTTTAPTVAMQPELDDVEGLLFVSFTSREALGVHVVDTPPSTSPGPPVPEQSPDSAAVAEVAETLEEKIGRLQAVLLRDLATFKHRQVIHPVLQQVGLKLPLLDPTQAIDLQYLGVQLPLPPPEFPRKDTSTTPASLTDGGVPFVSRTGKTSDLTKIKGWREKFTKTKDSSIATQNEGALKNRSAFWSDMLDEYLENEAKQISERAAAFSLNPQGPVAYELPAKSTSYVRTLDSVLKTRTPSPQLPAWTNRPCPLSRKSLLYSALTTPPPPLANAKKPATLARAKPPATPPQIKSKTATTTPQPPQVPSAKKSPTSAVKATAGAKASHAANPAQKSPPAKVSGKRDSSPGAGQACSWLCYRTPGLNRVQLKLQEIEEASAYLGHQRTFISQERMEVALSTLLTIQGLPKARTPHPKSMKQVEGPECWEEHCRLGCVCSSLNRRNRGPLHCRRTECMLGCNCFKRRIVKQTTEKEEKEVQAEPVYTVSRVGCEVQPSPGHHLSHLWDQDEENDPEPLYVPKSAPQEPSKSTSCAKRYTPKPTPQMREEDKDPVYKYFESMMTCARVREFNSKPPPRMLLLSKTSTPTPAPQAEKEPRPVLTPPPAPSNTEKGRSQARSRGPEPSKMLEIQSECNWDAHRKLVLMVLCRRLKQNGLLAPFRVGPYQIKLLSWGRKTDSSTIVYKICVSLAAKKNDEENHKRREEEAEDGGGESEEEEGGREEEEEEERAAAQAEEQEKQVSVMPFLAGVFPAGRLKARKKQPGKAAVGLIQVNGKSYSQARLLLGQMGALHPANRLAAFVTGRLRNAQRRPTKMSPKTSKSPGNTSPRPSPLPRPRGLPPGGARSPGATVPLLQRGSKAGVQKQDKASSVPLNQQTPTNPKAPTAPCMMLVTSQPSPAAPSMAKKVVLQSISSLQGTKLYRQPNGQLVKLVAIKPKAVIVGKNPTESPTAQQNQPDSVESRVIPPLSTPGPPSKTSSSLRSPPPLKPLIKFIASQHGTVTPSQSPSTSPLALSVSSSLKTPSFLGKRGTYSFRIFPPPANQASKGPGHNQAGPAGVTLPGGFTLIQLPKPGAAGVAAQPARAAKPTTLNTTAKPLQPRMAFSNGDMVLQSLSRTPTSTAGSDAPEPVSADHSYTGPTHQPRPNGAPPLSSGPRKSPVLTCDEEMASEEKSDAEMGEVTGGRLQENGYSDVTEESGDDPDSDDLTDTSDSDDDDDEDDDEDDDDDEEEEEDRDEAVDIETVEERTQRCMIAEMRAAARRITSDSLDSSQEIDVVRAKPRRKHRRSEGGEGCEEGGKRRNHTVTERLRRSEHRKLFNKLKEVLLLEEMDPKASKLHVLSQARKEINALVKNSAYLEEKKKRLTLKQSAYVKRIAHMSGKPEEQIRSKLREIFERQKRNKVAPLHPPSLTSTPLSQMAGISRHTVTEAQLHPQTNAGVAQPASAKAAGRGVLRLKVAGIPSPAPPTDRPATARDRGEVRKEEGEGRLEREGRLESEATPSDAPDPEPSGQKSDQTARKRRPVGPEPTSAERRVKEEEEEEKKKGTDREAHASNTSVEEDVSSHEEKILTPVDKASDPKLADASPPGNVAGLNSAIWKPLEQVQAGGNQQTRARTLRKGGVMPARDTPKDVGRERPDSLQDNDVATDADLAARTAPRKRMRQTSSQRTPVSLASALAPAKPLPLLLPRVEVSRLKPVSLAAEPPAAPAGDGSAPAKRGRGRPKKKPAVSEPVSEDSSTGDRGSHAPTSPLPDSPAVEIPAAPESPAAADCLAPTKRRRGRPPKRKKSNASEAAVEDVPKAGTGRDGSAAQDQGSPAGTKAGARLAGASPAACTRRSLDKLPRAGDSPLTAGGSTASPARANSLSKPVTRSALGKDFPSAKRKSWTDYLI